MNPELVHHLKALTRAIFYVTEEEDRAIVQIHAKLKKHEQNVFVYNAALGLVPITNLVKDWTSHAHAENTETMGMNQALIKMYKDDPKDEEFFYIITDPERWFKDEHLVRRLTNILHQVHQDVRVIKCLIFVGPRLVIPERLSRYIEVVHDKGLDDEEVTNIVDTTCKELKTASPPNAAPLFRGMTSYEIEQAITQSVVKTKKDGGDTSRRVDPQFIAQYKRNQIKKTDLVQFIDTSKETFANVGGIQRFKKWVRESKSVWTEEGQKFGLKPPRGVLLTGVWGCGKSLSAKAMANEWGLPLVQFELGKIRSSNVGGSEANLYRALRIIESVSPCVMWIDEAEKSLSGGQSSAQSDAGTTSRILGILSTWAQETSAPVCLALTANSLKDLPVEIVNRMNERYFFDLPNEEDRVDILKIHATKAGHDVSTFNLADLADLAKNLVGREIEQAIGAALVTSFNAKKKGLDEEILGKALKNRPRIIKTMGDDIKALLDWVGYDPDVDDGIRARFASDNRSEQFKVTHGG